MVRCPRLLIIIGSVLWAFIVIKLISNLLRIEHLFMQRYLIVSKELGLVSLRGSRVDPITRIIGLGKLDIHIGEIRSVREAFDFFCNLMCVDAPIIF